MPLYKELLEPTFSTCRIFLGNLCEVFGYSVITDFISTMFVLCFLININFQAPAFFQARLIKY